VGDPLDVTVIEAPPPKVFEHLKNLYLMVQDGALTPDDIASLVPENASNAFVAVSIIVSANQLLQFDRYRDRWKGGRNDIPKALIAKRFERDWFTWALLSQPIYHVAFASAVQSKSKDDLFNFSFQLKNVLRWLSIAMVVHRGAYGDPVQMIRAYEANISHLESQITTYTTRDSFGLLADLNRQLVEAKSTLVLFKPEFLGTRGAAKKSTSSAMRGLLVRSIDNLLPNFETERYAVISALLALIQVKCTPQNVRAILKHPSRDRATSK
jgi:hypothetical protein